MNQSFYAQKQSQGAEQALESLPIATLQDIYTPTDASVVYAQDPEKKDTTYNAGSMLKLTDKAVFCKGTHVATVSDQYRLVQHKDAFQPVINGLRNIGREDFTFSTWANKSKAFMGIILGTTIDSVGYGFRATNSIDGSSTINYGMSAKAQRQYTEVEIVEKERVTVWTYRQICTNGAKIKVPLKVEKYLDTVTRTKFQTLMSQMKSVRIRHSGEAQQRVEEVQFLVEAFLLMGEPIERMIKDAQQIHYDADTVDKLITKYIGQKMAPRIRSSFARERDDTLWALFNAITWEASHAALSDGIREVLLEKASNLLTDELEQYANEMVTV